MQFALGMTIFECSFATHGQGTLGINYRFLAKFETSCSINSSNL